MDDDKNVANRGIISRMHDDEQPCGMQGINNRAKLFINCERRMCLVSDLVTNGQGVTSMSRNKEEKK